MMLRCSRVYAVSVLVGGIRMYVQNFSLAATAWTAAKNDALPLSRSAAMDVMDRLHATGIDAQIGVKA